MYAKTYEIILICIFASAHSALIRELNTTFVTLSIMIYKHKNDYHYHIYHAGNG